MGLPLVLLIWASIRKEGSIIKLLTIYLKIASLLAISMLLLTNQRSIGYATLFAAPLLMIGSVWFWIDLNEELAELPLWRPLPFTIRLWRWLLTGFGLITATTAFTSLNCVKNAQDSICRAWLEAPLGLHQTTEKIFRFLFGANWTEPVAAFVGYIALTGYLIGIIQWILIRLPKQGRIAGDF